MSWYFCGNCWAEFKLTKFTFKADVKGGAEGAIAPLGIWMSEKRAEREKDSLICTISPIRFKNLTTALTLKFIYSEKAKIFCKIFTLLFSHIVPVKSKVKIWQNFAAISEYINFMYNWYSRVVYDQEQVMMARIP